MHVYAFSTTLVVLAVGYTLRPLVKLCTAHCRCRRKSTTHTRSNVSRLARVRARAGNELAPVITYLLLARARVGVNMRKRQREAAGWRDARINPQQ